MNKVKKILWGLVIVLVVLAVVAVIVAGLFLESNNSNGNGPLDEEVRQLTGMDPASYESAKQQHFKNKQCIVSALNREKTGRKTSMMDGTTNSSSVE